MTHTYIVTGMTCSGCAAKVQFLVSKVPGVEAVQIDLAKQEAEITMQKHVSLDTFQAALAGTKYAISEKAAMTVSGSIPEEELVTLKTYLPIFLIFGYITFATLLVQYGRPRFDAMEWMSQFMAGFFLVFSFFKLLDIRAFAMSYSSYDILAKRWEGYGYLYPFIELGLGLSFLIPAFYFWSNAITLVVMSISIIGVLQSVLNKRKIQCACLGAVFKLPMSSITIIEDALMIGMSALSLFLIR
jgi:copper chaperone CopZ